jgi:hypothetical protein
MLQANGKEKGPVYCEKSEKSSLRKGNRKSQWATDISGSVSKTDDVLPRNTLVDSLKV